MQPEVEKLLELHRFYKSGPCSKLGIAKALGVNRKAIRQWFRGQIKPVARRLAYTKALLRQLEA